jgi:hypothetical protein
MEIVSMEELAAYKKKNLKPSLELDMRKLVAPTALVLFVKAAGRVFFANLLKK